MGIVALDLSLTASGFYSEAGGEVWKTNKRGHERLEWILDCVGLALTKQKDKPTVFVEGFAFGCKRSSSADEIYALGWMVRHKLWLAGVAYCNVPPSTLKKYATGKGTADKATMMDAAIRRFGYEGPPDDNAVDAFLLWHLGHEHTGSPMVVVPAMQAAQAEKVEWIVP